MTNTVSSAAMVQKNIFSIPVAAICPNPAQPRRLFDERAIDELASSISRFGLIQPITVRAVNGGYELVSGERRLRACKKLGMESIGAIISNADDESSAFLAAIENLQREDLSFFEEAECFSFLIVNYSLTQQQLAIQLGISQANIANKLRLLKLPVDIRELAVKHDLSERHCRALLKLTSISSQAELIEKIVREKLSCDETEKEAEKLESCKPVIRRSSVKRCFMDNRLFINTFKATMNELSKAGVRSEMLVEESSEELKLTITIKRGNVSRGTNNAFQTAENDV